MTSPNLNRFIVAFLSIAVLTSSGLFAASTFWNGQARNTGAAKDAADGQSAFVEQLPGRSIDPALALLRAPKGPNATEEVAKRLAGEIIEENPEGPLERNGQPTILLPTSTEGIIAEYLKSQAKPLAPLSSPVNKDRIKKVKDSKASLAAYIERVSAVTQRFETAPTEPSEAEVEAWLLKSEDIFLTAIRDLYATEVPESLVDLHASFIGIIATPAEFSNLMLVDPVNAMAMKAEFDQATARRMLELESEISKLESSPASSLLPAETSVVAQMLGIKVAEAQWIDFSALAQRIVQIYNQVKQYVLLHKADLERAAIGYLKNRLLKQLADQTAKWIMGGGEPQFVTNWQSFLRNSANEAAGALLEEVAPELCGGPGGFGANLGLGDMSDLIRRILTPPEVISYSYYSGCTLDQVVQNFEDFREDLRNGGWLGYSALFESQNTFFGSVVQVGEMQRIAAAKKQEADKAQAESGAGFIGQMACDDGSRTLPNGTCADKSKPHVVTPGRFAADALSDSLTSIYPRIAGANDYKALAAVLIDAAISRLFKEVSKGVFSYSGNGTGIDDRNEQPSSDPAALARQILEKKTQALSDARSAQSALEQTISTLRQVQSICASNADAAGTATVILEAITPLGDVLAAKVLALKDQVPILEQLIRDKKYSEATTRFGDFFSAKSEATDMAAKRSSLENAYMEAIQLYGSCSGDATENPPDLPPTSTSTPTTTRPNP